MGASISNDVRADVKSDQIRLKELSPKAISAIKETFEKNPTSTRIDKKTLMSSFLIGKRETDILFDYFDMDGNGQIDNYEFTCAIAMVVHSSMDLRSEFLFKLYDFNSTNFLTRDDIVHLVRAMTLAKGKSVVSSEVESKTDTIINDADLDQDKKLSLKEFQSYAAKNREIFAVLEPYGKLLNSDPIQSSKGGKKNVEPDEEDEEENDEGNDDEEENEGNDFEEDDIGGGDEMVPGSDLYEELQKDKCAEDKTEESEKIKKGVEYGNGFAEENVEGDEFGAVKPWITNVVNTVPSTYQPSKLDGSLPDAHLELEFVHGYRCHDTRNNLRYTSDGEFVYHTAAVGIVYNKEEHHQRFFNEHFDDITALAIHPNRKIVATGEIGPYPLISIWDTEENKALVRIREPLTKGINHLAFSRDGKYLVATAADDCHNVAVFDWEKGAAEDISNITNARLRVKKGQAQCKGPTVGTCEGGRANILGVCFNKTGDTIAMCCVKEVNFITVQPGKLKKKKATGLKGENLTSIMCCGYLNNTLLCGTIKGRLLVCAGTQFTKTLKAHTDSLNSIFIRENDTGFITGGSDGNVLTWDTKYSITNRFSIKTEEIHSLCPRVRSIDEDSNGNILLGTRGGEIIEVSNGKATVYLRGHWDKELWGLCVHPEKDQYYTVGEDKLLGVWDIQTRKLKQYCILEEAATTVVISPNGKDLAIGCESGNFYIYDANTLKKKSKKKESVTKAVEEIKYSPCGNYLAVGGIDKDTDGFMHIFIFDVTKNYKRIKKMKGHQSRITHIDWSTDSDYIQSNSQAYELLYHSVSSGAQITKISSMRDTEWSTWTCVLGWPVQGIWPECASGDDINACDVDKTKRVIATSDDYSKVKLFRYPSPVEKAAFNQYNGHSSHVTCVRFTSNNKHVLSTGGNDKAIFQFKFSFDEEAADEAEELQELDEEEADPDDDQQDTYFKVEEIEGTEFGASKPWIGELQASSPKTKIDKNSGKPPSENIKKLHYVFGYRAFDTRMNVKYTGVEDEIVYHTAALGIVMNKKTNKQRYFTNHEEDIVSLAIHPNGKTVATGQMAAKGKAKFIDLYVWNIDLLPDETNVLADDRAICPDGVTNLKGCLLRAIRILKFSPDGKKLLSNGQDDYNSIALHDTSNLRKIVLIGTCKVDGARVLDACWRTNDEFVTVGPKHIKFFKVSGRNITPAKGVFGKVKKEPLVSVASAFKKIFTGTDKGNIITWEGSTASTSKNLCKNGPLYTLYYYDKDKILFAGGFDGVIYAFDSAKLTEKYKIDIQKVTNSPCDCGIRSLDANAQGEMLVGTKGGEIVEISLKSKTLLRTIMQSHYESELWGLTINPTDSNEVATGGGDKSLRIWDLKKNKQKKFMMFPEDFRAIDWSSDGKFIIVGTMPGIIYYVDVKKWTRSAPFKSIFYTDAKGKGAQKSDKDKWIQELKISPNNEYVAFGSHCGLGNTFSKIQVLQVTGNAKAPLKAYVTVDPKITSALTHLDWSTDNDRIVCNSLAFELKYVSIGAKSVIKASSCVWEPDLWNTWTCLFGYPVQGIWPPDSTGYIVNYTCLSQNKKVVATGDDFSLVKLFKSPCLVEHASYKAYGGHSSHVPKVRFTPNDRFLISVGGNDKSVLVWETDFGEEEGDDEEEGVNEEEENENEDEDNGDNEQPEEEEEEEEEEPPKKKKVVKKPPPKKKKVLKKVEEEEEDPEEAEYKKLMEDSKKEKKIPKKITPKPVREEENEDDDEEEQQPEDNDEEEQEENVINRSSKKKPVPAPAKKKKKTPEPEPEPEEEEENEEEEEEEEKPTPKPKVTKKAKPVSLPKKKKAAAFEMDEEVTGDNAGNPEGGILNEQWRGTCALPDNLESLNPNAEKPNALISLSHVFGYRTKDIRNNVKYINESTVVYQSGNLGIVHDLKENTQQFFTGHKKEILSFALNSTRDLVATGEAQKDGDTTSQIIIWNPTDLSEISRITLPVNGINAIDFSEDSKLIACVGLDNDHSIFVVDVKLAKIIAQEVGGPKKLFGIAFKGNSEFATVGAKHFKLWTLTGIKLTSKEGIFLEGADNKIGVIIPMGNKYITGTSTGCVYIWENEKFIIGKKMHTSSIDALFCNKNVIISGARDMNIVIMDANLAELRRISLEVGTLESPNPCPRSIDLFGENNSKVLLGTIASEILELKFEKDYLNSEYTVNYFMSGHFSTSSSENNQITGMTYWKAKNVFLTTCEDGTLRFWNYEDNKQKDFLRFDNEDGVFKPTSVTLSPNEEKLFIGFSNGMIRVYAVKEFSLVKEFSFRKNPITILKVTSDGKFIACATTDETDVNVIDILNADDYSLLTTLKGQAGAFTGLDWSKDTTYIASSSLDGEMRIFHAKKGVMVNNYEDLKNIEWDSYSRTYGWPVMGYYDSGAERLTAVQLSEKKIESNKVLALGNETGEIRVYNYPILAANNRFIKGDVCHAGKVTCVQFSDQQDVLFTAGSEGIIYKWDISTK